MIIVQPVGVLSLHLVRSRPVSRIEPVRDGIDIAPEQAGVPVQRQRRRRGTEVGPAPGEGRGPGGRSGQRQGLVLRP